MAKRTGIQLIDNNDEGTVLDLKINSVRDASGKITSGLVVSDTLQQNKALILIAHQGDFKFRLDLGVGIDDMLMDSDLLVYRHRIREHFPKDGLRVSRLDLYPNKPILIEADYG